MGWHDARFAPMIRWMEMKMEMIFFDGEDGNEDGWEDEWNHGMRK